MLTLRGSHKGEAFDIEISKAPGSSCEYECRIVKADGSEKRLCLELISRVGSRWTFKVDGKVEDLVISRHDGQLLIDWNNRNYRLSVTNLKDCHTLGVADHGTDRDQVRADMTGKVVTVSKRAGEPVVPGESLATVEAMKMLNQVKSPKAGTLRRCHVEPGSVVKLGDLLFEIE